MACVRYLGMLYVGDQGLVGYLRYLHVSAMESVCLCQLWKIEVVDLHRLVDLVKNWFSWCGIKFMEGQRGLFDQSTDGFRPPNTCDEGQSCQLVNRDLRRERGTPESTALGSGRP